MRIQTILSLSSMLLFFACQKESKHHSNATLETTFESKIQFLHASPGTAGIKLWQDQKSLLSVGRYYKGNTYYFPIKAGTSTIELKDSKSDFFLSSLSANFEPGAQYSLIACDSFSRITPFLIKDNPLTVIEDKAQVRIVNVLSSGESIDLTLNENKLFNNISYLSGSDYLYLDAGEFQCQILKSLGSKSLTPKFTYVFDAGKTYTIYVNGFSYLTGASGTDAIVLVNI